MAHDVFISYSSKNKTTADAICHVLEEQGIKCWIAPRDIVGGQKYGDVIENAIKNCQVFVIIFSEESRVSPWVESELNVAFTDRRTIVPFKIDNANLEGEMRLILNNKHWIEAYPNPELKFKDLIEAVSRSIGKINLKEVNKVSIETRQNFKKNNTSVLLQANLSEKSIEYKEPFLMSIEYSSWLEDNGVIVYGCIERGFVEKGNKLQIIGNENEIYSVLCQFIVKFGEISEIGFAGDHIGIILSNVKNFQIKEEMVIAQPNTITFSQVKTKAWKLDKPFLMAIEDTFLISGRGVVATGRIENGVVHSGDTLQIIGLNCIDRPTVCLGIEKSRKIWDEGRAGDSVGLLLSGINLKDVKRGQVLAAPSTIIAHTSFIAYVHYLNNKEYNIPIRNKSKFQFIIRTLEVSGEIHLLNDDEIILQGDSKIIAIELSISAPINRSLRFVIRHKSLTIGYGDIVKILD